MYVYILTPVTNLSGSIKVFRTNNFATETAMLDSAEITSWTTGSNEPQLVRHYYIGCRGLVFVVDSSSPDTFPAAKAELIKAANSHDMCDKPILVLANKSDVEGAASRSDVEEALEVFKLSQSYKAVMAVSAKNSDTLKEPISVMKSWLK